MKPTEIPSAARLCGGATQSQPEIIAQQLTLQRHFLWQAIKNQIEIDLAGNRNIETFLHLFLTLGFADAVVSADFHPRHLHIEAADET
jgi:hypothetical protein